jgi:hypothetical protein
LTSSSPPAPEFAALIRTTGVRDQSLREGLQSLALQGEPCLAIVIVHGSAESHARVQQSCLANHPADLIRVLHAPDSDPRRKRGYPINVGIDYSLNVPGIQYVFLLDDDDIVYPFFTAVMASAFAASEADVVYATANRREAGKPLAAAWPLQPYPRLFDRNFIPLNSCAIRAEALRRSGARADEEQDYLEDWLFLLRLLEHKFRFQGLDVTLSELRTDSAADLACRYDLEIWKSNALRIRQYINATTFPVPGADLARLAGNHLPAAREDLFDDSSTTTALHRRIWELEHSLSWKCTRPLRDVAGMLLRLRGRWSARV